MSTKRRFVALALCVALIPTVALTACSGDKSDASSRIVIGIPQDLEDSLDPHEAVAAGTKEILFNIYEGLLKPDETGDLIPAVAKEYSVSEDGLTYSFVLRDGVKFHNGNDVTAEDVKYSIEKSAGLTGEESLIGAFANIKEVNVKDDKNIDIVLSEPDIDFPAYVANINASIIPKDNDKPSTVPVGTGPYKYVSRSPQENIILKKFDEYWGTPANIEDVTLKVIPNADSIVMNLNGGAVDMFARLTVTQTQQLSDNFNVLEGEMNLVQAVYLNHKVEPFDNVDVCRALSYAVDVDNILELTSDKKGFPVGSSMFPAFKKYYVDLSDTYPTDIEKAKELLAKAGYPDGFSFSITVPSNYQPHIEAAQVVSEQLKKIGVKADIKLVEWNSWLSDVYSQRQYEATLIGVDASSLTATAMLDRFRTDASNNFTNYSNKEYDDLYNKLYSASSDEERIAIYQDLQRNLADNAANIYIQDMAEFVALSDKYEGYVFYPLYVQDFAKLKLKGQ
ncbi:MAG: ABC transporter substrate-binding protein [Lachnospiraceae bacterium]|nr:ABC transporter substrate-binding protein [Lachnospiraceae bacterium]